MLNNHISIPEINSHIGNNGNGNMEKLSLDHISRLGLPTQLIPGQATLDDIELHMIYRLRHSPSTAHKRKNLLKNIAEHPMPVHIDNPQYEDWIRHSDYREQIEGCNSALHNEWKAIRDLLQAYQIPIWNYKPPSKTIHKYRNIPHPNTVHNMIHHKYSEDNDKNRHIQYILLATFMIGLRNPSETCLLTLDDIQLDNNIIIITEAKKQHSRRATTTEPQYMTGNNCKSMKYWIDNIRPRYSNRHSNNSLFITLNGKPFTKEYLRKYLADTIQPHYPEYYPYCSRHWSATAKLIQEYLQTGHWNKSRVQHWLGHDNQKTTDTYIQLAEAYMNTAKYDWFKRVLKTQKKNVWGKHDKISGYIKKQVCDSNYKESKGTDPQGFEKPQREKNKSVCNPSSSFFFLFIRHSDMDESFFYDVNLKHAPFVFYDSSISSLLHQSNPDDECISITCIHHFPYFNSSSGYNVLTGMDRAYFKWVVGEQIHDTCPSSFLLEVAA